MNTINAFGASLMPVLLHLSAFGQGQSPTNAPAPNLDVRMIRMKLSAGDLPSAESILEHHRGEIGDDEDYVLGVSWVARGAALVQDWNAALKYAKEARRLAESKLRSSPDYQTEKEAVYALGTAIEVEAQSLVASGKKRQALRFLDSSQREQEAAGAPFNIRARIWKRRNQIDLVGRKAPAFSIDDHLGTQVPTLASLRGKPVILFFWWEACGDCKMQAAAFRKVVEKYRSKGVEFVAVTRFYDKPETGAAEKGRIETAWSDVYSLAGVVPVLISDEAMLRYGVSATPTFAGLDSKGVVRLYSPTRMTEERLGAEIERIVR
jgi:thiol-disulfide isomerase/thioredoxin